MRGGRRVQPGQRERMVRTAGMLEAYRPRLADHARPAVWAEREVQMSGEIRIIAHRHGAAHRVW